MDIFDGLSALGGLCLFLFGMSIMAEALQRRAGGRLGEQLRRMTRSRWAGFFTGLAVTAAVQSSSAAMVMVVGFVNSGLLTLGQAVGVIMGTNVGTTVTPWLLSLGGLEGGGFPGRLLRPAGFVPLLSLWGIIAYLSRNGRRRDTGQALLGFATLMQGMELMSGSVAGLAQAEGFRRLFTAFTDPLLGLLAGAVLTAVIQSSSASVGILQALAASGQVTVGAAVPIIMGQNIGTCITAMLSSVGASRNARRAALVHLLFNLTGAGVWLAVFWLVKVLAAPTMLARPVTLPGVAVIHTAFNLLCTMLLFPAAGLLERAVLRLLPGEEGEKGTELDPRLLAAPAAALEKCRELAGDMAALARDNLRRGVAALTEVQPASAKELRRQEERIDRMEDVLGTFLVRLSGQTLTRRDNARAAELGMTNTTFRNACGLDTEGHLSTARDVAVLSRYLLNTCPELLHYTGIWTDSLRNGQTQLVNTNKLLRRYSGITGLKTGTTSGAGVCISASATRDGLTLIAVVLGSPSSADRFHSATTLLDYGFANYAAAPLPTLPERPLALAVKGSAEDSVPLDYAALPETILIEKGTASALRAELTLPEALEAPVEKGRTVGKVSIFQDDTLLNEYEVKAAADAPLLTFGGALELLWQCLLGA